MQRDPIDADAAPAEIAPSFTVCAASGPSRVLIPVAQEEDLEAALAFILPSGRRTNIKLAIIHVTATTDPASAPAPPGYAETLLDHAEFRCRASDIAYETHLLSGDLVFSILDAAELLACDVIVMPLLQNRPWHVFFPTKTVREIERLRRDIPLVLIDAHGAIIRRLSHEPV